ncbi:MAG: hypothetical protein WC319_02865 [Candidatus Paceibacterota bacterium]|jgi:hypothetical protein
MINLLKHTYLLNIKEIKNNIELFWSRYQDILNNKKSSWDDLNEARAILYFLGYLYPEKIVLDSLAGRIKYIKPFIDLDTFLLAIDTNNKEILKKYENNQKFSTLKEFYLIIKSIKNRVKNKTYLDEGRFDKLYSKLKPQDYF